jgi:hypothetical protein
MAISVSASIITFAIDWPEDEKSHASQDAGPTFRDLRMRQPTPRIFLRFDNRQICPIRAGRSRGGENLFEEDGRQTAMRQDTPQSRVFKLDAEHFRVRPSPRLSDIDSVSMVSGSSAGTGTLSRTGVCSKRHHVIRRRRALPPRR